MAIAVERATLGSNSASFGAGTSLSFTTTAAVVPGGFIVVGGGWYATSTTVTSVTGGSLAWTIDKQGRVINSNVWMASAYAPSGLAAGTTITVNFAIGVDYPTIGGLSFTGVKTSSPVDGTPLGLTQVATAAWSTGNYTVAAGSVIVAVDWSEGTVTGNTPTGPSLESQEVITADQSHVIEYRIESGAGAVPVAGTWNTANTNTNIAVAYLADPQTLTFAIASAADDGTSGKNSPTRAWPPTDYVNEDDDPLLELFTSKLDNGSSTYMENAFLRFDTSSIPDGATIVAASLLIYVVEKRDDDGTYSLVADYYDFGGEPSVTGDMIETASPSVITATDIGLITASVVNTIAITDLSGISTTGFTGLRLTLSAGTPAGQQWVTWAAFEHAQQESRLQVSYTLPPDGIALRNDTLIGRGGSFGPF